MNAWIWVAIIAGLLVFAGIAVTEVSTAREPVKIGCSDCENRCNQDINCGLASCSAAKGLACGCGK